METQPKPQRKDGTTFLTPKIFFVEKKCYDKILYFFSGNSYGIFLLAYIKENG